MGEIVGFNFCEILFFGLIEYVLSFWIVLVVDDNDVKFIRKEKLYLNNVFFKLFIIENNV